MGELRTLRAGTGENLIQMKELELDRQVLYYHRLRTEGHPWLLWPESEDIDFPRHLRSIAQYRLEHRAVIPSLPMAGSDQMSREMRQASTDIAHTTTEIIKAYGK